MLSNPPNLERAIATPRWMEVVGILRDIRAPAAVPPRKTTRSTHSFLNTEF